MLGMKTVNKFADRPTAEKRTRMILALITDPEKRPYPFGPGPTLGQATETAMKGSVRAKDAPHPAIKSIRSESGPSVQAKARAADDGPMHEEPENDSKTDEAVRPAAITFPSQRDGSKRKVITDLLVARAGEFVLLTDLLTAIYGNPDVSMEGGLMMVLKGVKVDIAVNKQPVELRKQKIGNTKSFGLFRTN